MVRAVPHPHEGRFAIVTDVGSGMRWPRWITGRAIRSGRQNRVVLAPRRWGQAGGWWFRRRRWL